MGTQGENARSEARAAFKSAGLSYAALTPASMQRLRNLINEHMKASGAIQGTFRCKQRGVVKETKWGRYGELRCKADYFDNREAVTFNTDGFIGFAGWADDQNIRPILDGFNAWVREQSNNGGDNG
jgi:hypothetical protein